MQTHTVFSECSFHSKFRYCFNWAYLLKAASEDALVKPRPASAVLIADVAALLSERHVVTGWKVHSFTVSCHSANGQH